MPDVDIDSLETESIKGVLQSITSEGEDVEREALIQHLVKAYLSKVAALYGQLQSCLRPLHWPDNTYTLDVKNSCIDNLLHVINRGAAVGNCAGVKDQIWLFTYIKGKTLLKRPANVHGLSTILHLLFEARNVKPVPDGNLVNAFYRLHATRQKILLSVKPGKLIDNDVLLLLEKHPFQSREVVSMALPLNSDGIVDLTAEISTTSIEIRMYKVLIDVIDAMIHCRRLGDNVAHRAIYQHAVAVRDGERIKALIPGNVVLSGSNHPVKFGPSAAIEVMSGIFDKRRAQVVCMWISEGILLLLHIYVSYML